MCMKNMCGKKCCGMNMCFCGNKNLGLLLLRLVTGGIFLVAGIGKLTHMPMVLGYFAMMGIPAFVAYLVAICETVGGAMVVIGLFTRKAALVLGIIISFAIILVHSKGDFTQMQLAIVLFGTTFGLTMLGGGKYSVTGMCKCGGKCMACKDEKGCMGSGCCAGGTCGAGAMKCDGCTDKCAGGTCSMHEGKDMKCDGCDSCKDKCTMHEGK